MAFKKSELEEMKVKNLKSPQVEPVVVDRSSEILAAIKDIKLEPAEPVIVEQKIPDEILEQQREILKSVSDRQELPTYNFEVNRNSEGFIKNIIASPSTTADKVGGNIANTWYGDK